MSIFLSQLNGTLTLEENIADNIGIKTAYNAYKLWQMENGEEDSLPGFENYTSDQMFWLSNAHSWCEKLSDEERLRQVKNELHSPNEFRVIGTLSNSLEFSKSFNCPVGSKMNPVEKCPLFKKK